MPRWSGAGRQNISRSRRARLASRHVGGAASIISPACWTARTGDDPRSAKLLDASPFRARRPCHVPGGIFPLGRGAGASRQASGATPPCRQTRLSLRTATLDRPNARTTDPGGPMGPRVALAEPPRSCLWRTGPRVRETTRRARNSWTQLCLGRAASVSSQAVSSQSDGAQERRGELAGRRCRVDRRGCLSAPPHSTFRVTLKPIMVGHWGRASRWRRRVGYVSGALGRVRGEQPDERETPGRSAVLGAPPPSFARRYLPGRT